MFRPVKVKKLRVVAILAGALLSSRPRRAPRTQPMTLRAAKPSNSMMREICGCDTTPREALDTMVTVVAENAKSKKKAKYMDPSLLALVQLDHAGMLEPFVLFNRADTGIAQDYAAYRATHRDLLRPYLDEYVVSETP